MGLEDPLEKRNSYPLQYSGLENSMNCIVHGVTKSWTRLNDSHFHSQIKIVLRELTKEEMQAQDL